MAVHHLCDPYIQPMRGLRIYMVVSTSTKQYHLSGLIHSYRHKIWGTRLFGVLFGGTILGTLAITCLLTHVSYSNYPGGEALYRMNQLKLDNGMV
jgi:hypothetical protein